MKFSTTVLTLATFASFGYATEVRPFVAALDNTAVRYLKNFGYIKTQGNAVMGPGEAIRALENLQSFAGIPITGEMDDDTLQLLRKPRCGLPDKDPMRRKKRFALASTTWPKKDLTWRVSKYPYHLDRSVPEIQRQQVERIFSRAFKVWQESSALTFRKISYDDTDTEVDIDVRFEVGDHGDGYTFDGKGSVLAHAFYPGPGIGGDVHMDDHETWVDDDSDEGTHLFTVAVHEIGHSLGLSHSNITDAIMFPWYGGYQEGTSQLHYDDIAAIYQVYGAPHGKTLPPAPPTRDPESKPGRPSKPDICRLNRIDAMGYMRGELFAFHGKWLWRYREFGSLIGDSYPIKIKSFFHGLPSSVNRIDAIYESPTTRRLIVFHDRKFWVYNGNQLRPRFPSAGRSIAELGLPTYVRKVDAIFVWGKNDNTYIISGNKYWKFDENEQSVPGSGYPRSMSVWRDVSLPVDSAFRDQNKKTYFLHDRYVQEFNDERLRAHSSRPHGTLLFGCSSNVAYSYVDSADLRVPRLLSASSNRVQAGVFITVLISLQNCF